jgi:glycosyltransferase involved in cell wall biosynthesis
MKILQVSHGFPPKDNAGVELYTFYLSKALSARRHEVHVFCREEDPKREEFSSYREKTDGLEVTRVINNFTWRSESDPRLYYDNPFFDRVFLETLKRERPDLVHVQHLAGHSAHLVRIAKEEGFPLIFTLHDFFVLCPRIQLLTGDHQPCPGPLYGLECVACVRDIFRISSPPDGRTRFFLRVKDRLPFPVIKWTKRFFIPPAVLNTRGYEVFHRYRFMHGVLRKCDFLLTPSRFVRDLFLKYYPFVQPRIRVLPLGIVPFNSLRRSGTREGTVRFCYLGNILPFKGVHVLIDAFKALPQGKATLSLYGGRNPWCGSYAYYDGLQEQAKGYAVQFRGPYQRERLPEVLEDQDVVVLPSICPETFSLVVREANLMGLPVIASRIGAIPEAIEEGRNGFLFEPGNGEELSRWMLRFIEEPDLAKEMASTMPKAKSMDEHAMEMEEIYKAILRRN